MNPIAYTKSQRRIAGIRQHGSAVLMTVLIMLMMMSLLLYYNGRVTIYEQTISGNDRRAKLSHHAAEAGVSHAIRYFNENRELLTSGDAGGWFADATSHWTQCTAGDTDLPCSSGSCPWIGRLLSPSSP